MLVGLTCRIDDVGEAVSAVVALATLSTMVTPPLPLPPPPPLPVMSAAPPGVSGRALELLRSERKMPMPMAAAATCGRVWVGMSARHKDKGTHEREYEAHYPHRARPARRLYCAFFEPRAVGAE